MSRFRWSWGGIPVSHFISFFLYNLSFYVGSVLSPRGGNHILIRSIPSLLRALIPPLPVRTLHTPPSCATFSFFNCSISSHNLVLPLLTTKSTQSHKKAVFCRWE
ncbi:hypothetical protein ILYODFUR_010863 [Ilyodon furcidens]|uniref:Uncharacterized protein n=1 Tax=Ilyodon furcidens TaxID=33524 RepID=A0ABV0TAB5_9TELE